MRGFCLAIAFLAGLVFQSVDAHAGQGHVYLLKGLANVFSTGLDDYAAALTARGIPVTVANHSSSSSLAIEAAEIYKRGGGPIILVGHSLGAAATTDMADIMQQRGARVALIVNYGPPANQVIPSNVDRVVNYYGAVRSMALRGPGFRGSITNIDTNPNPEINHFNMDKLPAMRARTLGQIYAALGRGGGPRRAAPAQPAAASVQPAPSAAPAQTAAVAH